MVDLWAEFLERLAAINHPKVVEIGTRGWSGTPSRRERDNILAANKDSSYTGIDMLPGDGVDVVADVESLSLTLGRESVDAVVTIATLEHVRRPWIAGLEIARVLRPGGIVYCRTHQSFPLHGYPNDYFRFSAEALKEIFGEHLGLSTKTAYDGEVHIIPVVLASGPWDYASRGWIHVVSLSTKTAAVDDRGQWTWK